MGRRNKSEQSVHTVYHAACKDEYRPKFRFIELIYIADVFRFFF